MPEKLPTKKELPHEGSPCPFCEVGELAPSSGGKNLVCQKCGRVVVSKSPDARS